MRIGNGHEKSVCSCFIACTGSSTLAPRVLQEANRPIIKYLVVKVTCKTSEISSLWFTVMGDCGKR